MVLYWFNWGKESEHKILMHLCLKPACARAGYFMRKGKTFYYFKYYGSVCRLWPIIQTILYELSISFGEELQCWKRPTLFCCRLIWVRILWTTTADSARHAATMAPPFYISFLNSNSPRRAVTMVLIGLLAYTMPWRCVPNVFFWFYTSLGRCFPWTDMLLPALDRILYRRWILAEAWLHHHNTTHGRIKYLRPQASTDPT